MFGRDDKERAEEARRKREQHALNTLKAFRDIGERFTYLGIEMLVREHSLYSHGFFSPKLHAHYVDNSGIVRTITFVRNELPSLYKENEKKDE